MPIDPNIPLQAKGVQLPTPESQLNMMASAAKLNEYTRSVDEQNALRDLIKSGVDIKSPEARQKMYEISPDLGMKFEKSQAELNKTALEGKKLGYETKAKQLEVQREQFANLTFNPSNANVTAHIEDSVLKGELQPAQAQALLQQVMPMNAAQRKQFFTDMGVKAETRFQGEISKRGQDISAATARRGQDLAYNPELQGRIEEAKVLGKARGEELTAPVKDIQANVKALKSAGYDPETGKDSISELIGKSTGSFVGAGTDLAARSVGISTGGAKAIAALKTYESKLTQDLLGGKMGAGISNADRDFIVAGIGQIADPTLPVETRQAAWNAVKERMRVAGMVPAPKGEATGPIATQSGASVSNW